ncbi:MAG: penicillin-binding protein activator [Magnetospirillum sp. WYHS-4]
MFGMLKSWPLRAIAAAALLAVAACQSSQSQPARQDVGGPVLESAIPNFPWPKDGKGKPAVSAPAPAATVKAIPVPPPANGNGGGTVSLPPVPSGYGAPNGMAGMSGMTGMAALSVPAPAESPPNAPGPTRAALLLPLSGPNASLGKAMANAAQLAMFAFADKNFELLPVDTQGTPNGAEEAARRAVSGNATVILGPLLATEVKAVAPIARAAGIPVVSFSSDRSIAMEGVYTMGFLPRAEVRKVTEYAISQGLGEFAAFAPDNTYGRAVVEAYRIAVEAGGGKVVKVRFYDPGTADHTAAIKELGDFDRRRASLLAEIKKLEAKGDEVSLRARERLKKQQTLGDPPFKALLVAEGGKRLQSLAAMLPYYDIDPGAVRMLGTGQWDEPGLASEPALVGGWYAAPLPQERAAFTGEYESSFGGKPPRLATLAYDATALAAVLGRVQGGGRFSKAALTDPNGFSGRDGIFRFLPDGTNERGLAVLQIERGAPKVLSPPPTTFEAQAH